MANSNEWHLVGYASGIAGVDPQCGRGPLVVQVSPYCKHPHLYHWDNIVHPLIHNSLTNAVKTMTTLLAETVSHLLKQQKKAIVIGGDHSSAIGTWSGVYDALHKKGDIGLVWVDAHMDSHTPETSHSGRLHGMPLACLLGYGEPSLTSILNQPAKIKPENLCLIGVRSYEQEEADFLQNLHVKIYFIDEVKKRGLSRVLNEAISLVTKNTSSFGLSIDLDAFDPNEVPGVDVPEINGIYPAELIKELYHISRDSRLATVEIAEFDPAKDKEHKTEKIIMELLDIFIAAE